MKGTRFSQEKIIGILKEAECKTSTVGELCRKHGVSEQTFYRWRRKYGGLSVSESRRLKDLKLKNLLGCCMERELKKVRLLQRVVF